MVDRLTLVHGRGIHVRLRTPRPEPWARQRHGGSNDPRLRWVPGCPGRAHQPAECSGLAAAAAVAVLPRLHTAQSSLRLPDRYRHRGSVPGWAHSVFLHQSGRAGMLQPLPSLRGSCRRLGRLAGCDFSHAQAWAKPGHLRSGGAAGGSTGRSPAGTHTRAFQTLHQKHWASLPTGGILLPAPWYHPSLLASRLRRQPVQ